jgi:hypothetical protein
MARLILEENLWPVIARHFPDDNYVYMDDNAPVHRSHLLRNYIAENSIKTTTWPAQSPDINVTENIWLKIKRELENVCHRISTRNQLLINRFSADLTLYWFPVCHFRCKEFNPLVIWIWNQNIAISTIVGTSSHINSDIYDTPETNTGLNLQKIEYAVIWSYFRL